MSRSREQFVTMENLKETKMISGSWVSLTATAECFLGESHCVTQSGSVTNEIKIWFDIMQINVSNISEILFTSDLVRIILTQVII